ncbi:MAG: cyclic nucleotide-binding domain-containing protein [Alphaproteobacteria bacterium]|nr:cyclic nucleotide-binding domain-containing protein [Alphaproteobacteria bacterium]
MTEILDIIPFQFLGADARRRLLDTLEWHNHPAGRVIVRQGDLTDDRVFLLASGKVDVIDHRRGPDTKVAEIEEGHYFGERPALFGIPRVVEIRAQTDCQTAHMPGSVFLDLVRNEPHMAHALTFILRDKQGVFTEFDRFLAEVRLGAQRGHIVIGKLLPIYKQLYPSLHRLGHSTEVDYNALAYVVRRLPANVTNTFMWFATDEIPVRYAAAQALFTDTTAEARRRVTWEMMPGKSLVLLRDGMSDLLDLVSLLCIYAVEARKLRRRLRDGGVLCALASEEDAAAALAGAFSPYEVQRLEALWPGEVHRRLLDMSLHHEDISIHVYRRTDNYNSAHAETWTQQIALATRSLLGAHPWELPDDFPVHIISSNTHSVTNCLSPWLQENAERVLTWGREAHPEIMDLPWEEPWDRLAALMRPFMAAHPEMVPIRMERDAAVRVQLDETAFTGIRVQLFDLQALRAVEADPHLPRPSGPGLIVNIDYAFGQQAEPIVANLVNLFGRRIRSINVLGKAGGMRGKRGDILVATAFVNQSQDVMQSLPQGVDLERLRSRVKGREVHCGRVLTVLGTVLQNDRLLHYYDKLWDCVGLEMEGSYYGRQALESRELGLIDPDTALRFVYYVSDLPLEHTATLAASMSPLEGIPPLYGITREVLTAVFE